MKIFSLSGILSIMLTATIWSAPHDRIDPKSLKNALSISIGGKGAICFKQMGVTLTEPKLTQADPEKTPCLEVYNFERKEALVHFTVINHFPKTLRYRAAVRMKGRRDFMETSILPAYPNIMAGEPWEEPVEEIILFEFKFTEEKL